MGCREFNIIDFFCFTETKKIYDHEVTDLCFPQEKINYDYMGRRVRKKVYTGSTGNWTLVTDNCFVYDNYLQIEKIDMMNNAAIVAKRIWFNGKLVCDINSTSGTDVPYYAMGDANKNITEYFDANGNIVAHYEYSPFGKITKTSGTLANDFDFRFSSEVFDKETNLVYYNYRYYSSDLGRWLSRDPIGEKGGVNLYMFCYNNTILLYDYLGFIPYREYKITVDGYSADEGDYFSDGTILVSINWGDEKLIKIIKSIYKEKKERIDIWKYWHGSDDECAKGTCCEYYVVRKTTTYFVQKLFTKDITFHFKKPISSDRGFGHAVWKKIISPFTVIKDAENDLTGNLGGIDYVEWDQIVNYKFSRYSYEDETTFSLEFRMCYKSTRGACK